MIDSLKLRTLKQLHIAQHSTIHEFQQITATLREICKYVKPTDDQVIAAKIPAVSLPIDNLVQTTRS